MQARLEGFRASILEETGVDVDFSPVKEALRKRVTENLDNGGRGINNILEKLLINPLARHLFDEQVRRGEKRVVAELREDAVPADIIWRAV